MLLIHSQSTGRAPRMLIKLQTFPSLCHLQLLVVGCRVIITALASTVELGSDGVSDAGQLLKLLVKVLGRGRGGVLLEPVLGLLDSFEEGFLVIVLNLAAKTLLIVDLVLERVGVVLELVARLDALTGGLVLLGVLLSLLNHALNVFSAETTLVVGDGDALSLASALVDSGDLEDTVGIKLKSDLDLGNTTGRGRNVGKLELAKVVAVSN